jgi:hypothetical protein
MEMIKNIICIIFLAIITVPVVKFFLPIEQFSGEAEKEDLVIHTKVLLDLYLRVKYTSNKSDFNDKFQILVSKELGDSLSLESSKILYLRNQYYDKNAPLIILSCQDNGQNCFMTIDFNSKIEIINSLDAIDKSRYSTLKLIH